MRNSIEPPNPNPSKSFAGLQEGQKHSTENKHPEQPIILCNLF